MLKKVVKAFTPPVILDLKRLALGQTEKQAADASLSAAGPDRPDLEYIDFYGNTSLFALEVLQQHGALQEMRLFSLGNKMAHLADYLALFSTVYHNTLLQTAIPFADEHGAGKLVLLKEDFFGLPKLEVDCVISHAAIHCLNDTRYGNRGSMSGWQRPYQAAAKLREIVGDKSLPVIVSIAAHKTESFIDDNARLSHEKFVASFSEAGFTLQKYFFDYLCYGLPFRSEYFDTEYRRSQCLPTPAQAPGEYHYVIGNYYFL
ncbi:MAG: hypothetical protein WBP93_14675 [Pyrinomonadaceae bacterium]